MLDWMNHDNISVSFLFVRKPELQRERVTYQYCLVPYFHFEILLLYGQMACSAIHQKCPWNRDCFSKSHNATILHSELLKFGIWSLYYINIQSVWLFMIKMLGYQWNCDWLCENRSYRPWEQIWFFIMNTMVHK